MKNHKLISYFRIFFGLLVLVAVVVQFIDSATKGGDIANFFSFFTIQANILAAIVLLIVGFGTLTRKKSNPQFAFLRGAATLYMVMTGIIFALLLSDVVADLQTTIPWVNTVLHYAMPVVMLIDWLAFPPKFKFSFRTTVYWLAFPILYLIYSLIRGVYTGWYPYPFINPDANGWPALIITSIFIAIGTIVLAWVLTLRTGHKHLAKR
jgi:hypothetical protein